MALRREIKLQTEDAGLTRYRLGPAKVYLDDLQLIYETLAEANEETDDSAEGKAAPVTITAGEASADLPEDLVDAKPEELQHVRLTIKNPAITVSLSRRYASIYVNSSNRGSVELANGIRNFINHRKSFRAAVYFWGIPRSHGVSHGYSGFCFLRTTSE